jgi:glycosyltransferase involved in cell wall biosynthesis
MIKVAWLVPNTPSWIGGLNYFVNLASALLALPERRIEPVVLGETTALPEPLRSFASVPYPGEAKKYSLAWFLSRLDRKFNVKGGMQARIFMQHGIKLFSHGWPLGLMSPVPSLCWIPDFQHKHLPHMFSQAEIVARDISCANVADKAQAVLLSSADAEKDFLHYFPHANGKTRVLRFVAAPPQGGDTSAVLALYNIEEPYFHIPNQLWLHKNHGIVLEALRILKAGGACPLVVSTGQTDDYRHPGYFDDMRKQVSEAGLTERFRFLGLIDFTHASALMRAALAMINPSRFEGWSTTVEEAKSLGKCLLLSDIPVHREQAPERGLYFGLDDAEALAHLMRQAMDAYSPAEEEYARHKTEAALPERMATFAHTYEDIVLSVLAKHV